MKRVDVLDHTLRDGSSVVVAWPEHIGVEGLSAQAARTADAGATTERALAALRAWLPGLGAGTSADALGAGVRPDRFPYANILAHYHAVGRTHAATELTEQLRQVDALLRTPILSGDGRMWPLREWLPSTFDQETGDYDSYLVARLLESLADGGGSRADGADLRTDAEVEEATDQSIDVLLGALAADLALVEADALKLGRPNRLQLQRTRACLNVLCKLGELAPKWAQRPDTPANPIAIRPDDLSDSGRLAEAAGRLGAEVWQRLPGRYRLAVDLAALPTTPLHDELMFIRCIQIFETLYRQIYRCLVRANAAMQTMDVSRARAEVADATGRLALSPVLFRVVTTMPRAAFAIIREYTRGRSAIQSRSYRKIELVCATRLPSPVADKLPAVEVAGPTLEESFLALAARLGTSEVDGLAAQMQALDRGWRAMKRTHWGITLKIIGRVPGTGGTAGADYLKETAEIPLFPELAAQ